VTHSDVFSKCLTAIGDSGFRARLKAIGPNLAAAANSYEVQANAHALHLVPRVTSVGAVSKEELVALYSEHLSATRGAARSVYDQIKNAAPNKKCPLCGVGTVAVLDHHLPKAKYPDLAIVPANLVPACYFCNDSKKARYPRNAEEQTLHPYYDNLLMNTRWLKATLNSGSPSVLVYSASPPSSWSQVDQNRVLRHFAVCGLAIIFASNASDELGPLKIRLTKLHDHGGKTAVQHHLAEEAESHSGRPNSWKFAMYQELATNPWFPDGGFRSIH
jgi:5-methylcytosine-specific restriction endonuclease McrA